MRRQEILNSPRMTLKALIRVLVCDAIAVLNPSNGDGAFEKRRLKTARQVEMNQMSGIVPELFSFAKAICTFGTIIT